MLHLTIPHDTWVLVGDGEKALVLRNEGDELHPNLRIEDRFEHDNPPTREQGTDRPGRTNDSSFMHKSAVENTDWHRLGKDRFAKEIADRLYRSAHAGAFDRLILVAPPQTLHSLREALHAEVRSRVIAEVDKELTQHPVHAIEKILTSIR